MTFDCMTADELALWRKGAESVSRQTGYLTQKPCADCPAAFRVAEIAAGRCHRLPPITVDEDRRERKAAWMRLYRERVAS